MSNQPKRRIHWPGVLDAAMIYGGALVIVLMVTYMAADPFERSAGVKRLQIAIVGIGLLINQVGVWHIASHFTSSRRFYALRVEVDDFIKLVRQMNTRVLNGDRAGAESIQGEMHTSVDRMIELAGKEGSAEEVRRESFGS